jgi:cysteinyl-tRNA synthetase
MESYKNLSSLSTSIVDEAVLDKKVYAIVDGIFDDMNDDFNTPKAIAGLFELVTIINSLKEGQMAISEISQAAIEKIKATMNAIIFDIFGLKDEAETNAGPVDGLMNLVIDLRHQARSNKDWPTSDKIRDALSEINIQIKDGKEGTSWSYK